MDAEERAASIVKQFEAEIDCGSEPHKQCSCCETIRADLRATITANVRAAEAAAVEARDREYMRLLHHDPQPQEICNPEILAGLLHADRALEDSE
jgi:hypothetical protein